MYTQKHDTLSKKNIIYFNYTHLIDMEEYADYHVFLKTCGLNQKNRKYARDYINLKDLIFAKRHCSRVFKSEFVNIVCEFATPHFTQKFCDTSYIRPDILETHTLYLTQGSGCQNWEQCHEEKKTYATDLSELQKPKNGSQTKVVILGFNRETSFMKKLINYLKENDTKFIYRFGSAEDNDPLNYKLLDQESDCEVAYRSDETNLVFHKDDKKIAFYEHENLDYFESDCSIETVYYPETSKYYTQGILSKIFFVDEKRQIVIQKNYWKCGEIRKSIIMSHDYCKCRNIKKYDCFTRIQSETRISVGECRKLTGSEYNFHKNGQLEEHIKYFCGDFDGDHLRFDDSGKLTTNVKYFEGGLVEYDGVYDSDTSSETSSDSLQFRMSTDNKCVICFDGVETIEINLELLDEIGELITRRQGKLRVILTYQSLVNGVYTYWVQAGQIVKELTVSDEIMGEFRRY